MSKHVIFSNTTKPIDFTFSKKIIYQVGGTSAVKVDSEINGAKCERNQNERGTIEGELQEYQAAGIHWFRTL